MIEDRLRFLVRHLGAARLAGVTAIERRRWQTVATNYAVKPRVEDLEALIQAFPQYDLWLWRGQADPENGQLAPIPRTCLALRLLLFRLIHKI